MSQEREKEREKEPATENVIFWYFDDPVILHKRLAQKQS